MSSDGEKNPEDKSSKPPVIPPKKVSVNISKAVSFFEEKEKDAAENRKKSNLRNSQTASKVKDDQQKIIKIKSKRFSIKKLNRSTGAGHRKRSGTLHFEDGTKFRFDQQTNDNDGIEQTTEVDFDDEDNFHEAQSPESEDFQNGKVFEAGSLQNLLMNTKLQFDKRKKAKDLYLQKHKKLQGEYEKKIIAEHKKFLKANKHLSSPDENEWKNLENIWLSVPIKHWDALVMKTSYDKSNLHTSNLWHSMRKKGNDEVDFKKTEGEATNWALKFFSTEDRSQKAHRKKKEKSRSKLATNVITICGVDDNKDNRTKATDLLAKNNDDVAVAVTLFLEDGKDKSASNSSKFESKILRAKREQEKSMRRVILRVIKVEKDSEILRCVMVLDRNQRPCVGGLEKVDVVAKSEYSGEDKVLTKAKTRTSLVRKLVSRNKRKKKPILNSNASVLSNVTNNTNNTGMTNNTNDTNNTNTLSTKSSEMELLEQLENALNEANEEAETQNGENVENDSKMAENGSKNENDESGESEDDDDGESYLPGYRSTEDPKAKPLEYFLDVSELLSLPNITVLEEDQVSLLKQHFNEFIPHITYQQESGFQRNTNPNTYNNVGDFRLVDVGVRLGLDPLVPLEEYTQEWKNGTMCSLKHNIDGPIRFVGFNETGFGFFEDKPIALYVKQIQSVEISGSKDNVIGANIVHMTLFDTNDQVSFDTLYLKEGEQLSKREDAKIFAKDSVGNRLAYRIIGRNGHCEAVLYPFQGRVKRANIIQYDVNFLKEDAFVSISVDHIFGSGGSSSESSLLRLGKVKFVPLGIVLGSAKGIDESKNKYEKTVFVEMIRQHVRNFADVSGLVDIEIYVEGGILLEKPRQEAWPVECLFEASKEQIIEFETLLQQRLDVYANKRNEASAIIESVELFLKNKNEARKDKELFEKEATVFIERLTEAKLTLEKHRVKDIEDSDFEEVVKEIENMINVVKKNVDAAKRAEALIRISAARNSANLRKKD